ncbi:hypothetical protein [Streptomyces sp. CBG33]|uniref:hypothetical protein n=1 Tax=Streptomyces sp. CBG33 TaxID=2762624 RepID=UPI00164599DF|nr:hypothetical protein [Streptomyces sp. CBG33]
MTTKPPSGAACVGALLGFVAGVALEAWLLMLVVGAVAGLTSVPTIGYGTAVLLTLGLSMVAAYARRLFRSMK